LVDEGVLHGHQLVLQPPIVRPQGFHQGVQGLILSPVLVQVGAQLGEVIEFLAWLALQLLRAATKRQTLRRGRKPENNSQSNRGTHLKNPERPASVEPECLA
jgi:hypothetical protein